MHTQTQIRSCLLDQRLDVAYLRPAAVCGYCVHEREKRRLPLPNILLNIFLSSLLQETINDLILWCYKLRVGLMPSELTHTHISDGFVVVFGGFLCRFLCSFFIRKDFLVPLGAETCTALPKQQKWLALDQSWHQNRRWHIPPQNMVNEICQLSWFIPFAGVKTLPLSNIPKFSLHFKVK